MPDIYNISKPCQESWNKMSMTEKGRFCKSCQKEVIDFSNLNDNQILEHLKRNPKTCAHIRPSQLKNLNKKPIKKRSSYSKIAALLAFGALFSINENLEAKPTKPKIEINAKATWKRIIPKNTQKNDSITISGVITDEDSLPIPGVNILLKGSTTGTQTDFDGFYSITIAKDKLFYKNNVLVFTYVGMITEEFTFDYENKTIDVKMRFDENMLDGEIVVERNVFQKVGFFFKRLFTNHH